MRHDFYLPENNLMMFLIPHSPLLGFIRGNKAVGVSR